MLFSTQDPLGCSKIEPLSENNKASLDVTNRLNKTWFSCDFCSQKVRPKHCRINGRIVHFYIIYECLHSLAPFEFILMNENFYVTYLSLCQLSEQVPRNKFNTGRRFCAHNSQNIISCTLLRLFVLQVFICRNGFLQP